MKEKEEKKDWKELFANTKFKEVEVGMSGGVSVLGLISSIVGVLIIVLIYNLLPIDKGYSIIIFISALLGSIIDSILGSLVQRKNICEECLKITEKNIHCEKETKYHSGIKWINNSMVNFLSNTSSIIIALCLFFIF